MAHREDVLVWGEPYDRAHLFDRMMRQLSCFAVDWPCDEFFLPGTSRSDLSQQWVANLYPTPSYLKRAHRAFFDTLFATAADAAGYKVWGVKEVRLTTLHARYLKWLYPGAKFLLLIRHPLEAYRSYRTRRRWFRSWPDDPVLTPYSFGRNWADLAADFVNNQKDIGGMLLRYEDLDTPEVAQRIEDYTGWPIERPSNMARIGSSRVEGESIRVPAIEQFLLTLAVRNAARRAGYDL